MQKWEYLEIYMDGDNFSVMSPDGEYFTDEDYKVIDPKGKRFIGDTRFWESGINKTRLLLAILNKLGDEGWEAIGNVNSGHYFDVFLLLKRQKSVTNSN